MDPKLDRSLRVIKWRPVYYSKDGWFGNLAQFIGHINFDFPNSCFSEQPIVDLPKEANRLFIVLRDFSKPVKGTIITVDGSCEHYAFRPVSMFNKKYCQQIYKYLLKYHLLNLARWIAPLLGRKIYWVSFHPAEYLPKDERFFKPKPDKDKPNEQP